MQCFFTALCAACRVTQLEADRLEETREQREQFQHMFRQEIERQSREKGVVVHLPPER